MPSFDIVSEVDLHNLTNAVDQANRLIGNRFDFKGVDASFSRAEHTVTMLADGDFQLTQMLDILRSAIMKAGIDPEAMDPGEPTTAGKQAKMLVQFKNGLDKDLSKKIVKKIKESKMKVQASIQGDAVRVTGKKRDDLQEAIALMKGESFGQPLQFNNFRD